jgi:hypothetical protein
VASDQLGASTWTRTAFSSSRRRAAAAAALDKRRLNASDASGRPVDQLKQVAELARMPPTPARRTCDRGKKPAGHPVLKVLPILRRRHVASYHARARLDPQGDSGQSAETQIHEECSRNGLSSWCQAGALQRFSQWRRILGSPMPERADSIRLERITPPGIKPASASGSAGSGRPSRSSSRRRRRLTCGRARSSSAGGGSNLSAREAALVEMFLRHPGQGLSRGR